MRGYEAAVENGTAWVVESASGSRHAVLVPNVTVAGVIAAGANGIVFVGEHRLCRQVTVKVWPPRLRPRRSVERVQAQALAEARKVAMLKHPKIAAVYDIGELSNGWPYTVAEYVPGVSLRELRPALHTLTRPHTLTRRTVVLQVLDALRYAEEADVLHGDLHDGNVIVDGVDTYVIDFGTSAFVDPANSAARHARLLHRFVWTMLPELSDYRRPLPSLDERHGKDMLPVLNRAVHFVLMLLLA